MYEDPSTKWHSITPQETGSCIVSAVRCSSLSVTVTEGRKWTTLRPRGEFLRMVDVIVFDVPHYLPFILVPSTLMASVSLPKIFVAGEGLCVPILMWTECWRTWWGMGRHNGRRSRKTAEGTCGGVHSVGLPYWSKYEAPVMSHLFWVRIVNCVQVKLIHCHNMVPH